MTQRRREDGAVCRCREPSIFPWRVSMPRWLFHWPTRISASWRLLLMRTITYWAKRRMWNGPYRFWSRPVITSRARVTTDHRQARYLPISRLYFSFIPAGILLGSVRMAVARALGQPQVLALRSAGIFLATLRRTR